MAKVLNMNEGLMFIIVGVVIIAISSVILTGDIIVDYFDGVANLETNSNVSELYILFLQLMPFALPLGGLAFFLGGALKLMGKI